MSNRMNCCTYLFVVAILAQVGCFDRSILLARSSDSSRVSAQIKTLPGLSYIFGPFSGRAPLRLPFGWRSLSLSFYLYLAGLIILALVLADKYYFIFIDPFLSFGITFP